LTVLTSPDRSREVVEGFQHGSGKMVSQQKNPADGVSPPLNRKIVLKRSKYKKITLHVMR
jgi:hypothetical protein